MLIILKKTMVEWHWTNIIIIINNRMIVWNVLTWTAFEGELLNGTFFCLCVCYILFVENFFLSCRRIRIDAQMWANYSFRGSLTTFVLKFYDDDDDDDDDDLYLIRFVICYGEGSFGLLACLLVLLVGWLVNFSFFSTFRQPNQRT